MANVKKTLASCTPSQSRRSRSFDDEEHQSNKLVCRVQASGTTFSLDVTHELVGSADFRELQKLAPSAIGLGSAPYKIKAKGEDNKNCGRPPNSSGDPGSGQAGAEYPALQRFGRNEPGSTLGNHDEPGSAHVAAGQTRGRDRRRRDLHDSHGRRSGAAHAISFRPMRWKSETSTCSKNVA